MAATDPTPPPPRPLQSAGCRRSIEAHSQAAPPSRVAPVIAQAVERQTAAPRPLTRRALPERDDVPDDAIANSAVRAPSLAKFTR